MVKKDWLYNQYVKLCKEKGIRPKHKQIFSKLVFTVFPRAGSCRLGSIGSQVPYYFGIKRRREKAQKKDKLRKEGGASSSSQSSYHQPQTRSALGRDDPARLRSPRPIPIAPRTPGVGGKRKHEDSLIETIQQQMSLKKIKAEEQGTIAFRS